MTRLAGAAAGGRPLWAHAVARWATVAAGAVCAVIAWFAIGADGTAAALLATGIVVGFFWSGTIPLFVAEQARLGPGLGLAVLLLTYTLRLAVVLLLLVLLGRAGIVDQRWLGVTIIACALTWTVVHAGAAVRRRSPAGERG